MAEDVAEYLASASEELTLARTASSELGKAIHRDFAEVYLRRATLLLARARTADDGGRAAAPPPSQPRVA